MGTWLNRSDSELQSLYKNLIASMIGRQELYSSPTSHYSGAFGFQSLLVTTRPLVALPDQQALESVRAHEAFHGFQAMAFQSVRELFRSLQSISRRQMLTLAEIITENVRINPGETIFEAGRKCKSPIFKNSFKTLDSSISTLEKSLEKVNEVTVFDLIEGSAAAVEILNRSRDFNSLTHLSLASTMDTLKGVYGNAWRMYRLRGGESAAVFALLCCTSLRYGSVSPPNFDNLPSPQEVFEYLTRFSKHFDTYVNNKESDVPVYSLEKPLGIFEDFDFNPRKADLSEESWGDYPPSKSEEHHFPDEMFEEEVESALESYKENRTQDQLRLQDNLFGVSMALASAVDAVYIRVGPPIDEGDVSGAGKMIYDQVAHRVNRLLPGLCIEEVLLRAITQPDFQSRLADIFETEVSRLEIAPWHDSSETISHEQLVSLFDLAQNIEAISVSEYADRQGNYDICILLMPDCCDQHKGEMRTLGQLACCKNKNSISSKFQEMFMQPFSSIWSH